MSTQDIWSAIDDHLRQHGATPAPDLSTITEAAPSPLDQRAGHIYHAAIAWAANFEPTAAARSHAKRAAYTSPELAALHAHNYALAQRGPQAVPVTLPGRDRRRAAQHARDTLLLALMVCGVAVVVVGGLLILGYGLTALRDASTLVPLDRDARALLLPALPVTRAAVDTNDHHGDRASQCSAVTDDGSPQTTPLAGRSGQRLPTQERTP